MRFVEIEDWALRDSILHRRDARSKILFILLALFATSRGNLLIAALFLGVGLAVARLPILPVLVRGCVVLPFSLSFALASILAGEPARAGHALLRSYLSALWVVLLLGCTTLPVMLDAFRRMGVPDLVLEVIQFVYRYLTLIGEQAKRMSIAAAARGAKRSFAAVTGSVGVLFARSYNRAEAIHNSMLARGYAGSPVLRATVFSLADAMLLAVGVVLIAASLVLNR